MSKDETLFKFKKHDNIGSADADDDSLLINCFVDTGDLELLMDLESPRNIIVGRTGSGKTALLRMLQEKQSERVLNIPPESLSLSYISNSTILKFVETLGVNLNIFYKLLWRHVFSVELIKKHFHINSDADKHSFYQRLMGEKKDKRHQKAIEYLEDWGDSFWEETEHRIQEITNKLEKKLEGAIGVHVPQIAELKAGGGVSLSEEVKKEVEKRAQNIVNQVQIRQLSDIITVIDDFLDDPMKQYFILVDRLDEGWVEDNIKYQLVRALIETVRDFRKIKNAKIIIVLRQDLIEKVFRVTRNTWDQEEKYESTYLRIKWNDKQLKQVMDTRIDYLIENRYTSRKVQISDIFPRTIDGQKPSDYIISRTLRQPRDVIHFINKCIDRSIEKKKVSNDTIRDAEGEYSRDRLRYLADEWALEMPHLPDFAMIFKKMNFRFSISKLNKSCEDFCLNFSCDNPTIRDYYSFPIVSKVYQVAEGAMDPISFRNSMVLLFYKFGFLGIKMDSYDTYAWSIEDKKTLSATEIDDTVKIEIHPAFWRVLGINSKKEN